MPAKRFLALFMVFTMFFQTLAFGESYPEPYEAEEPGYSYGLRLDGHALTWQPLTGSYLLHIGERVFSTGRPYFDLSEISSEQSTYLIEVRALFEGEEEGLTQFLIGRILVDIKDMPELAEDNNYLPLWLQPEEYAPPSWEDLPPWVAPPNWVVPPHLTEPPVWNEPEFVPPVVPNFPEWVQLPLFPEEDFVEIPVEILPPELNVALPPVPEFTLDLPAVPAFEAFGEMPFQAPVPFSREVFVTPVFDEGKVHHLNQVQARYTAMGGFVNFGTWPDPWIPGQDINTLPGSPYIGDFPHVVRCGGWAFAGWFRTPGEFIVGTHESERLQDMVNALASPGGLVITGSYPNEQANIYARWVRSAFPTHSVTIARNPVSPTVTLPQPTTCHCFAIAGGVATGGDRITLSAAPTGYTNATYEFVGWTMNLTPGGANGQLIHPDPGDVMFKYAATFVMGANAVVLTANWQRIDNPPEPRQINVTNGTANHVSALPGTVITVTAGTPPAGQEFADWSSPTPGVVFANANVSPTTFQVPEGDGAITIVANWRVIPAPGTRAITINSRGTGATATPNPATVGATVTLNAGTAPPGEQFAGWTWTSPAPAPTITNAASPTAATFIMPAGTGAVTLTANWEPIPAVTRAITIVNGGTGANAAPNPAAVNSTVTLNAGTAPAGQRFVNWTSPGITIQNAANQNGATFAMPAGTGPVIVTANWEPIPPAATRQINVTGGTANPATAAPGTRVTVTANTPPAGQQFLNWTVAPAGYVYFADANASPTTFLVPAGTGAVNITANFGTPPAVGLTITFNTNHGVTPVTSTAIANPETGRVTLPPAPTRAGFTFAGWYTVAAATGGTRVTAETDFRTIEAREIFARWTAVPAGAFVITINPGEGTHPQTSVLTDGNGRLASLANPTRSGHTFAGWWTAATGGERITFPHTFTANTTLFARWWLTDDIVTLTFNPNGGRWPGGGTGNRREDIPLGESIDSAFGMRLRDFIEEPTLAGFTFDGWVIGNADSPITRNTRFNRNTTLMARWTPDFGWNPWNPWSPWNPWDPGMNWPQGTLPTVPAWPGMLGMQGTQPVATAPIAGMPAPTPVIPPGPFPDVPGNVWFTNYVITVTNRGLFQGTGVNFEPNTTMNRAMFVTVLHRLAGTPAPTGANPFGDVPAGVWHTAPITWAANVGIIPSGGNFEPYMPITRQDMAVMISNYLSFAGVPVPQTTTSFTDQELISPHAVSAVNMVHAAGIMRGRDTGAFDPHATAIRAEVAAIFARLLLNI